MDGTWQHSHPIDPLKVNATPLFTTLPIRVNAHEAITNKATRRAPTVWETSMHDGLATKIHVSFSSVGNLGAFAYAEAPPDRLHVLTYLTDLGMLHDDSYKGMAMNAARKDHCKLGLLFVSSKKQQKLSRGLALRPSGRSAKLRHLVAQMLLKAMEINREMGKYMFNMYDKGWLAVAGKAKTWQF